VIEHAARMASMGRVWSAQWRNGFDGESTLRGDGWASPDDRGSDRTFGIEAAKGRSA
jgi:hypothetical protein